MGRWESDPSSMRARLAEHDALLKSTIRDRGGYVFAAGGDGFAAAFSDALGAVRAALEAQARLDLPVRMGLHTGSADERDGNYFGRTLNRCARSMSAGHGGQILISDSTASLVRDDALLTDLGEHTLPGLTSPIRVWQVGGDAFPPLRTGHVRAGNLSLPLDEFVGRLDEMMDLLERLAAHRLVTIVGVGGMGKTRLAVEAADQYSVAMDGGTWFVDLGLARSDDAVLDEVATSLGVRPAQGQPLDARVVEFLEVRSTLVVFDNCEHIMRGSAQLIDTLLRVCPGLRVLATSREALMVRGEHVMAVGPLATDADGESESDAVALFVAVRPCRSRCVRARRWRARRDCRSLPSPRRDAARDRAGGGESAISELPESSAPR